MPLRIGGIRKAKLGANACRKGGTKIFTSLNASNAASSAIESRRLLGQKVKVSQMLQRMLKSLVSYLCPLDSVVV